MNIGDSVKSLIIQKMELKSLISEALNEATLNIQNSFAKDEKTKNIMFSQKKYGDYGFCIYDTAISFTLENVLEGLKRDGKEENYSKNDIREIINRIIIEQLRIL